LFGTWTPITEQLPKIGHKVLVSGQSDTGHRWRSIARWQPAGTIDATFWDDQPEGWWDESGDVCTNPTDEWMEDSIEAEVVYPLHNVTHWMHLPPLPNVQAQGPAAQDKP
jgi:hypothetical protein